MLNRDDEARDAELSALRARIVELEAELKIRDEFIVAAAHELRNPISPLVLHAQRLATTASRSTDGTVSAKWLEEQLALFQRRLGRFLSALHRILDISRLHAGRIDLVLEPVDLSEVVAEVVGGFERELSASHSELTLDLAPSLTGEFDRTRVDQIVSNLVSNAIRYGNSGPIAITLRAVDGQSAELTVADHGVGIDEADQARIFERFQRGPSANRAGFGVGLWIVRELSEAMGGSVRVHSRAGEGATFLVKLPTNQGSRSTDDS